jgi:aminoglycoside N3'-acetyltransferase
VTTSTNKHTHTHALSLSLSLSPLSSLSLLSLSFSCYYAFKYIELNALIFVADIVILAIHTHILHISTWNTRINQNDLFDKIKTKVNLGKVAEQVVVTLGKWFS